MAKKILKKWREGLSTSMVLVGLVGIFVTVEATVTKYWPIPVSFLLLMAAGAAWAIALDKRQKN